MRGLQEFKGVVGSEPPWRWRDQGHALTILAVICLVSIVGTYLALTSRAAPSPSFAAQMVDRDPIPVTIGKATYPVTAVWVDFKNNGTTAWTKNNVTLVTANPAGRGSQFALMNVPGRSPPLTPSTPTWPNDHTVYTFSGQLNGIDLDTSATTINPGSVARFLLPLDGRAVGLGSYREYFGLVTSSGQRMDDPSAYLDISVVNRVSQLRGANMHPLDYKVEYNPPNGAPEPLSQIDRELDSLSSAGATVIRIDVSWIIFENTTKGSNYNTGYMDLLDKVVQHAHARGISVVASLSGTPCWATSAPANVKAGCPPGGKYEWYPPTNASDYGSAAAYLSKHLQAGRDALEVWNEPNLDQFMVPSNPSACDKACEYTKLVKAAHTALKGDMNTPGAAPNLTLIAGTVNQADTVFLGALYGDGIGGNFDALSLHMYNGHHEPWQQLQASQAEYDLAQGVPRMHLLMIQNNDGAKKLWLDEFGHSTCVNAPKWWSTCETEAMQGQYLHDEFRYMELWPYLAAAIQYDFRDDGTTASNPDHNWGFIRHDFSLKASYASFQSALASPTSPQPLTDLPTDLTSPAAAALSVSAAAQYKAAAAAAANTNSSSAGSTAPGTSAQTAKGSKMTAKQGYDVVIKLRDRHGKPLKGALVMIAGRTVTSDSAGTAHFNLSAGKYKVTVKANGKTSSFSINVGSSSGAQQFSLTVAHSAPVYWPYFIVIAGALLLTGLLLRPFPLSTLGQSLHLKTAPPSSVPKTQPKNTTVKAVPGTVYRPEKPSK